MTGPEATVRIASIRDIEAIESRPYGEYIPHASVPQALDHAARQYADRAALTYLTSADPSAPPQRWTYGEFIADVRRAANMFHRLAGGDEPRIAMLLPAIPQAYFTLWGGETAGTVCPINYLLNAEHVAELVRTAEANIVVALGPDPDLDIWSRISGLKAACPRVRTMLAVGGAPDAADFDDLLAVESSTGLSFERAIGPHTLAALFHTGGTTGAPKLAQHTHGNQLHSSWSAARLYSATAEDVIVNGFPMFHVAGSFVFGLSILMSGGEVLLPTLLGMRNSEFVARYWQFVERHRVTLLAAVPTVISTLLAVAPSDARIDSVRALLTGGSPLAPDLAAAFEARYSIPVRNILGMTECAGVISIEPFAAPRVPGSCGLRLPFTEVCAFRGEPGERNAPCPPGTSGVLHVRGPNVGPGYTDERRNAGTYLPGGWLATGDIGHVDGEGRIFVTGRAKDLIIRSGHNIDPALIEETLMRHPDVAFAAAVGEPDEYAGELPVAYVVLKEGRSTDAVALSNFCRGKIAERPACPKRIEVLDSLPLTAVGKVYKPALRLRAVESAIKDRLALNGLDGRIDVSLREAATGPLIEFVPADDAAAVELDPKLRALMAPFALSWHWRCA